MAYANIPGVKATYLDGAFLQPERSNQAKILILGTAESGLSGEIFNVSNVRNAESEFGSKSEIIRGLHEAVGAGADNVSVMRIGGRRGSVTITDDAGGMLIITPEYKDNKTLERYKILLDGSGSENRLLVYDIIRNEHVYDTFGIIAIDEGQIDVIDTGLDFFSVGTLGDLDSYVALEDLLVGSFAEEGDSSIDEIVILHGEDSIDSTLVEKYAFLNQAYHNLDFRDMDMIAVSSDGVYIDAPNIADGHAVDYFKGLPVKGSASDALGYLWQYVYKGRVYTYFTDSKTFFTENHTAASGVIGDLTFTALKTGESGNNISVVIDASGAPGPLVTVSEPAADSILISIVDDGTTSLADALLAVNSALDAYTMTTGELASTVVEVTSAAVGNVTTTPETSLSGGEGGSVLTHTDLTGEAIPAEVEAVFNNAMIVGNDSQLRECNFAHQLATFCDLASTQWKAIQGSISFSGPSALSRNSVADWIGTAPIYRESGDGQDLIIASEGDNGSGVLGHKLTSGMASSSGGYRNSSITSPTSSSNGLAFGGLIKTKGSGLPNASDYPDLAYGILDGDELLDSEGRPYDLGKFIYVCYDHPVHRNSFSGGSSYRGPIHVLALAKLATIRENEEPIGDNGRIGRVTSLPRIHASQLDSLAKARLIGLRQDDQAGVIFVSFKTAAHPTSDYSRSSTIRCVNRHIQGIRRIARAYIGKDFSAQKLVSLQAAIDGYLKSERENGYNSGAIASLSYTRSDKILGRLKVRLRMVPPFAIEAIDVETSLASDESELN